MKRTSSSSRIDIPFWNINREGGRGRVEGRRQKGEGEGRRETCLFFSSTRKYETIIFPATAWKTSRP